MTHARADTATVFCCCKISFSLLFTFIHCRCVNKYENVLSFNTGQNWYRASLPGVEQGGLAERIYLQESSFPLILVNGQADNTTPQKQWLGSSPG